MKFKELFLLLSIIMLLATITSCSKDSNNDNQEAVDLIIGEWLFVSENDYRCGTDEVVTERLASDNGSDQTFVFKSDMTYESYDDGVLNDYEDLMGTWENIKSGVYRLNYKVFGQPTSDELEIEFVGKNTMNFGVDGKCVDVQGENIYTYTVWSRQ